MHFQIKSWQSSRPKLTTCFRKGKTSAQIPYQKAKLPLKWSLSWRCTKLETNPGHESELITINVCCQVANEMQCLKANTWPKYTCIEWTSFCFQFEDFLASCYSKQQILKICPKFQLLSSHFSEVDELLYENSAGIMQKENISTTIYVQYRFAVMQFGTCCLNLTINLSNPKKVNPQASKNYYVRL